MWDLRIPQDVQSNFTWLQAYVQELLKENGASVDTLLADIIDISKNAVTSTPLWDVLPDYKTQMAAKKLLLEMSGMYKQKWWTNISFDFRSLLFNGKDRASDTGDSKIQPWEVING